MAHFAKLDDNNVVIEVVVVNNAVITDENGQEQEQLGIDFLKNLYNEPDSVWVQTSYNGNFRANMADAEYTYDPQNDVFIPPAPYDNWVLDTTTYKWKTPVNYPSITTIGDPSVSLYITWDQDNVQWKGVASGTNYIWNPLTSTWSVV